MESESDDNYMLTGKAAERYFDLFKALQEFSRLFSYDQSERDDRAVAILGGTFLEMVLEHILLAFLPEDDKEVTKLMEFNQPLGSLSTKISMAYCLGLVDKLIKDDLTLVRKIRNKFAHDLYASFDDQQIKSWCQELKWHPILMMHEPPADATTRDIFQVGVHTLISHLHGCVVTARRDKRTTKNRFAN